MKKLIIIGGMGNGTVAASTVEDINMVNKQWKIIGFLNDFVTEPINDYPVLGKIDWETVGEFLKDDSVYFLYTLISTKMNYKSLNKLTDLKIPIERFATIIHPTSVVSKFAKIGHGVSIHPFVNIGPNVTVGNHVQIYSHSLVGHNTTLGDYTYIANNSSIGSHITLENGAYLGPNCSLLEKVTIGEWGLVGIGSVVVTDVPGYTKVMGNPARAIGKV